MPRLSGVQRDVFSLYRRCLRAVSKKPTESRPNFRDFVRREFRKNQTLNRKDFGTIEFMLRKGQRQLEIYDDPSITNVQR